MIRQTNFPAEQVTSDCIRWIQDWFSENGPSCKAVIGISGGKDSSVTAALCVKALGTDRVLGVLMPQGRQRDIDTARRLCAHLKIPSVEINIGESASLLQSAISSALGRELSAQSVTNLPARIRMSVLYGVSQTVNGRVANTCNLSEDFVGYSTRYGDSAGDFSPLSRLTVFEVRSIGRVLDLPAEFIDKVPEDGLTGKSDEENLGFSYEELDLYIREDIIEDPQHKEKIDRLHKQNLFKLQPMPVFPYKPK